MTIGGNCSTPSRAAASASALTVLLIGLSGGGSLALPSNASAQSTAPAPTPTPAPTQTAAPAPARPPYLPYRFDEDWRVMRDPAKRTDWWDTAKYVPLGSDERWYLSLGGEARMRYEQFEHFAFAFGAAPQDDNGYVLQRYLFHADWHLGPRVRVFTEVQSGLEDGRNGGPRPTDKDKLDLHEAFADFSWGQPKHGSLTVRVGRQEVAFGTGRLVSAAEGLNVRRSFDGLRLIARRGTWTFNSTALRIVSAKVGVFDDHRDPNELNWGAGGSGAHPWMRGANLAVYYLGLRRDHARFDQGTANNQRHTFGTRTWGRAGGFDYDEEVMGQVGTFGQADVRAWAVASENGYTWRSAPARPRVGLRTFVVSGDSDPHDTRMGSFDPLFPGIAYSGRAGLLGPTNLIDLDPSVTLALSPSVTVTGDWAWFWRTSTRDAVYRIDVGVLKSGQNSRARRVGSQGTVEVEWRADRHVTVWGSLVGFRAGEFIKAAPQPGKDIRYVAIYVAYRF